MTKGFSYLFNVLTLEFLERALKLLIPVPYAKDACDYGLSNPDL